MNKVFGSARREATTADGAFQVFLREGSLVENPIDGNDSKGPVALSFSRRHFWNPFGFPSVLALSSAEAPCGTKEELRPPPNGGCARLGFKPRLTTCAVPCFSPGGTFAHLELFVLAVYLFCYLVQGDQSGLILYFIDFDFGFPPCCLIYSCTSTSRKQANIGTFKSESTEFSLKPDGSLCRLVARRVSLPVAIQSRRKLG